MKQQFNEEAQKVENALWQLKNAILAQTEGYRADVVKIDEFRKWMEETYGTK
jgi:hypothetical protein